uniref:Deoxyribonuclease n=1 Tax=Myripristis murdjan TaxID=586833 RepID=A0A667YNU8_9TELE
MRSLSFILLFLVWGVCGVQGATVFRICAFNIQSFGEGKASKTKVMHTIVRIIARCDVSLLQEVRDHRRKAFPQLLAHFLYDHQSERLGRSDTYQEQYVFVYRTGTVTVTDQYQYPDTLKGDIDAFAREPFVVRFSAPKTALKDFVLIPLHTSPNNTTKELDAVVDVFNDIRKKWKTENVIFLGDFNADCGYLAKKNRKNVRLITDPAFIWLINDKNDTTVRKSTDCAYDRIVVHGEKVARAIVPLSAKPFNFKKEFRLSEDQALEVSDHYPVEVLLKASASRQQQVSLSLLLILLALTFNCS